MSSAVIGPTAGVRLLLLGATVAASCRSAPPNPLSPVRFHHQPIVTRIRPALPVPEPPPERPDRPNFYFVDRKFAHADRQLQLLDGRPAEDVNALGEVPASSWWEPRDPTPDEVRRGPPGGRLPVLPLTVEETKGEGYAVGFFARDAEGRRFLVKLDAAHTPEVETSGHVVVHRLLWALGYHVPFDHVVEVAREDLRLAEGAELKRGLVTDPLRPGALDALLGDAPARRVDGERRYRLLVSEFVSGRPLGGSPQLGVRREDPNDRIPHQRRRSLRGLGLVAAWLDHWDMKDANTLDVLVEGDGGPYVRHLLIDFGKAMGGFGRVDRIPKAGFGHLFELSSLATGWAALGLRARPWERRTVPKLRGVGWFTAQPFDPGAWRAFAPYAPFRSRDPNDDLWAALRVARLSPAHVEAAVAAGRYSEDASARTVLSVLLARRQSILTYAFGRRAPLDGFHVTADRLCWTDWSARAELGPTALVGAEIHRFETARGARVAEVRSVTPTGRCLPLGLTGGSRAPVYRVARILASADRVTEVHLIRDGARTDVVGVVRGRRDEMAFAHP